MSKQKHPNRQDWYTKRAQRLQPELACGQRYAEEEKTMATGS